VQDYAEKKEEEMPPEQVGAMINAISQAFRALVDQPELLDKAAQRELDTTVAAAVHLLVTGLSRATKHPPSWFLVAGKRHTPLASKARTGREPEIEGDFVAAVCLKYYERISGQPASGYVRGDVKPGSRLQPHEDGPYVKLVRAVFAAMGMKAAAHPRAKAAIANRFIV
jgi:hypothetical protein